MTKANIDQLKLKAQISRQILLDAKKAGYSRPTLKILAELHINNIEALCKAKGGKRFYRPTANKMIGSIR